MGSVPLVKTGFGMTQSCPRSGPLRIGIDAREVSGEPTGVGRVVAGLLGAWPEDDELLLYSRRPLPWEYLGGRRRSRVIPGPRRLPGSVWEQTLLPRRLRGDRVAALFSPAYSMPVLAPCGVVVGMHDCAWEARPWEFGWRQRWRRRWAARSACRRAAFLLVGSRFSAAEVRHWYQVPSERIVTAPYGVGDAFRPVSDEHLARVRTAHGLEGPALLFVGAPLGRRDVGGLIDAIVELRRDRPTLQLWIVGPERRDSPRLRELDAAASAAVRWLGYVPEEDLPAVYAAATVVAYPSAYEGFGLPVLEALACGTPVVASDAGSLSELFAGRAWLVDDRGESWRNALARLLDDADERRRWVERALPWAQRRDWGAAARLLRALLVEAAGDPANGSRR